ncbi:GNAT family N-acetyltransferase [Yinghuangia aomiensis]
MGVRADGATSSTSPSTTPTRSATEGGPLPVGTTSLSIDDYVGTAGFLIVLGEERRGRGLAARVTRLSLQAAFDHGLRSVHLAVPNLTAAIRAYTCAGFQRIGVRRARPKNPGRGECTA